MLGDDDQTTTTKVEMPAWQENAMQNAINGMNNAETYYQNPDQVTAAMNPWLMDGLSSANYASGAGADQVAAMNQMGMNQAGVGDLLTQLGMSQANMGAGYASGAGDYIMSQLTGGGGGGGGGYAGGVGNALSAPRTMEFEYDQGTYDQIWGTFSACLRTPLIRMPTKRRPAICSRRALACKWVRLCLVVPTPRQASNRHC